MVKKQKVKCSKKQQVHPFEVLGMYRITGQANDGAKGSVTLLLTKNPPCFFSCPLLLDAVSCLNGSRVPDRVGTSLGSR